MTEELSALLERMKALEEPPKGEPGWQSYDEEHCHGKADDILCEALLVLGQDELVESWAKVGKWYA